MKEEKKTRTRGAREKEIELTHILSRVKRKGIRLYRKQQRKRERSLKKKKTREEKGDSETDRERQPGEISPIGKLWIARQNDRERRRNEEDEEGRRTLCRVDGKEERKKRKKMLICSAPFSPSAIQFSEKSGLLKSLR